MTLKTDPAGETANEPTAYSWYVVFVLMLVYALSFLDRKLPFILAEPIKHDLNLNDTEIGLLTGLAFTLVYAVAGLPIARYADRGSRKTVVAIALAFWSLLTSLGGFAGSFIHLALARTGVAIGEAACTPAAHSIIGDRFPTHRRATALGIYAIGSPLGILLGLWLGGLIAHYLSWRSAMIMLGAPGLVLALIVFHTVREPARAPATAADGGNIRATIALFFKTPALRHMLIGGALVTTASGASNAFGPAYVMRTFGTSIADTGLIVGLLSGGAGLLGAVFGGWFGDRLRRSDPRWALWMVGACLALGGPFLLAAFTAKSLGLYLCLMAVPLATAMVYAGPCFATMQTIVPVRMRSVATAIYLFALTGIGSSLGPLIAGVISDLLRSWTGAESLGPALMVVAVAKIWGGGHYIYAGYKLRPDDKSNRVDHSSLKVGTD